MRLEPRKIAVATAGFCAFLNLYSPQALLPALAREFGAGAAEIDVADAGMRERAAHEHRMQHARQHQIGDDIEG